MLTSVGMHARLCQKLTNFAFVGTKPKNIYPSEHRSGKWGVITQLGKIVIEFEYDEIEYHEPFGHSLYYLRKNDKWGLYCEGKRFPCTYTKEEVKKLKWY